MGQSCSSTCRNVEPDAGGMSRADSPDPVMYDLMRKSIQATTSAETNHYRAARRKSPGQNHLLYRNSKIESGVAPLSLGSSDLSSSPSWIANETDLGQWLPSDTPVACPTRLLIRRRSLRVVEEGAGTHIYAIRYPEDTPDKVISEHTTTRPESARQEQCPPKKVVMTEANSASASSDQTGASNAATLKATTKVVLNPTMIEGTDFFSPAAMSSRPRKRGKYILPWSHIVSAVCATRGLLTSCHLASLSLAVSMFFFSHGLGHRFGRSQHLCCRCWTHGTTVRLYC